MQVKWILKIMLRFLIVIKLVLHLNIKMSEDGRHFAKSLLRKIYVIWGQAF